MAAHDEPSVVVACYASMGMSTDTRDTSDAKLYAQLISLAVHEFRTPASVVGGYLRMLERDTDPTLSERQRKMIEEAGRSCARIVALVAELSEISKLDAGTAAFEMNHTTFSISPRA